MGGCSTEASLCFLCFSRFSPWWSIQSKVGVWGRPANLTCLPDLGTSVSNSSEVVPTYTWRYNSSSSIDPSINLNANGSGTAYALACQSASQSWTFASSSAFDQATSTWPVVPLYTSSRTVTSSFWDVWTTDCEGITHVRGTTPTSTTVYVTSTVYTDYTITPSYSMPTKPSCAIQPSDCKAVLESYSAETSALDKWASQFAVPFYVTSRPRMPECTSVCSAPVECMIMADHVELIYWPVTTTGANSCGMNGTTVTDKNDGPSTIVTLGMTFTSPTPYLSFRSISAYDWGCGTQIGAGVSGTIISIQPDQLSSARGWHLGRSAYSFNLADLNGFVTSAAFFQMQGYDWSGPDRNTIFDNLYYPTVWLPDLITELKPEWKTCSLSPFGVNDPPIQLTTAKYVEPTTTAKPIETPGYEISKTAEPGATATNTAQPSALPQGNDPLASKPAHGKPTTYPVPTSGPQPTKPSSNTGLADWIVSALGFTKSAQPQKPSQPQQPSRETTTIYLGKGGFSMQGQKSTMHISDFYSRVVTKTVVQTMTPASDPAYAVAYETVDGHTAIVGDDMTLSIGGPVTEIDGYTVSAAEDGLVLNSMTIPYMAEASDSVTSGAAASTTSVSESTVSTSSDSQSIASTSPDPESGAISASRTSTQPAEATSIASSVNLKSSRQNLALLLALAFIITSI